MRLIVAHNFYKQAGGEDEVFASEMAMLRARGHEVHEFVARNDNVELMGKLAVFKSTLWNSDTHGRLKSLIRQTGAQLVHFHNTFPLLSPSVYYAARSEGAAVVQTLHNFRLVCPAATLFRDGAVCEDCLGNIPWRAVQHKCYRGLATSVASATLLTTHRAMGTYRNAVDAYIVLSEFARQKFIYGNLPTSKIFTKPNFVDPDPLPGDGAGDFVLFVGRLSEEKGIRTLLAAWKQLNGACPLKIAGDGPLRNEVEAAAKSTPGVEYLGRRPLDEICDLIGQAKALIFPSVWYEGMPRVIVESFAKGTPVLASKLGTMAEMIQHGRNGWLFTPGDAAALAEAARQCIKTANLDAFRCQAREDYLAYYTASRNYDLLMEIYEKARENAAIAGVNGDQQLDLHDANASSSLR